MAAFAATINEGDIIKTATNPDVYIAKYVGAKKFKRLILNPAVFSSYGHLKWSNLKTVTQAEMDAFTTSDLVKALGDTKVYKLVPNGDVGTKQWLNMTAEAFTAGGYDWDAVYVINNVDRDNYTASSDITGGTSASPSTSASTAAGSLSVALASDTPAAGVAVGGAARVPFTKVSFTAGSAAATITGLTVQRTGLSDDAVLSSIALIDAADNTQIGLNQTLNSAHQVVFTDTLSIPANTTKSYLLSANMPASLGVYAGQIAGLSLVGVTTSATVSGVLPISGNGQTINGTLSIGTATVTAGSLDPGVANTSKSVGTTAFKFSSARITAGSAEDVTVYSIRWNQSGSAASGDLSNVVVSDGTTDYMTSVSSDGKYYTASFGTSGIVITKGLNKEFTVKANIASGSGRTIAFDIYRNTDVVTKGNTYGYYLTPAFTANTANHAGATTPTTIQEATPYFQGAHVTVASGTLRVDKSSSGAPTANITRGATGQLLGAFDFVAEGETVNISAIELNFDHTGIGSTTDITSVTLAKEDGTVLATGATATDDVTNVHPATLDGTVDGHVHFSGTITFPVGTTKVLVKGNLSTDFVANDTFRVGFNTPATKVTSITGGTTGNAITATPAAAVWGNTMTLKGGSLVVTVSGTPVSQIVISGTNNYVVSNYLLDASASGEDVRVTAMSPLAAGTGLAGSNSYFLYDGTTKLNSTSPTIAAGNVAFTLDTPLVVSKGTIKTVALKTNIIATATNGQTLIWGIAAAGAGAEVTATGVSTGQSVTPSVTAAAGPTMTFAGSGQYSVALDASTPTGKLLAANTTGNTMTVLRFKATSEQINVSKIRLALTSASSTGIDLGMVYVYDGSTLLGSGVFANSAGSLNAASSTFTLTTPLQIGANEEKVVTIKADIAAINTTNTVATAGHDVIINYYGSTSASENVGTGQSSGAEIAGYSPTTAQSDAYIYRSIPTVTKMEVSTTKLTNSTMDLFKFKVAADAKGDIDLYKFTFRIATSVASVGNLTLVDVTGGNEITLIASTSAVVYAGAGGAPWTASTDDIQMVLLASPGTWGGAATPRTVSAGSYREFVLRGTVTGATTAATVLTQLQGDAGMQQTNGAYTAIAATVDGWATDDDFIWSDWSAASHTTGTADWTNGYLVSGLPSSNTVSQTLSF